MWSKTFYQQQVPKKSLFQKLICDFSHIWFMQSQMEIKTSQMDWVSIQLRVFSNLCNRNKKGSLLIKIIVRKTSFTWEKNGRKVVIWRILHTINKLRIWVRKQCFLLRVSNKALLPVCDLESAIWYKKYLCVNQWW